MIKRIVRFCKITIEASPLFFILNLATVIILCCTGLGVSYAFKFAVDHILAVQNTGNLSFTLALPILLFFFLICIGGNPINLQKMMITLYTNKAKKMFAKKFMEKSYLQKQDSFYDSDFYDQYSFVKKNMDSTTNISATIFNRLAFAVLSFVISGIYISALNPIALYLLLGISVLIMVINRHYVKKRVELNAYYIHAERKAAYYKEMLGGKAHAKELRIFQLADRFLSRWSQNYKTFAEGKYAFEKQMMLIRQIPVVLQRLMQMGFVVYLLYLVSKFQIDMGEFTFLTSIMGSFMRGISEIIEIATKELAENYMYAEKYENFVGNLEDLELPSEKEFSLSQGEFNNLCIKNVSYAYPHGDRKAVEDVNLTIRKGEIVSLLGYNGSGKSTLSKLMCGLLEDYSGEISLNGKDIQTMPRESLYRYFGIGFQDFTRYSLTLKENVAMGMVEQISDDVAIQTAIEKGNLGEVIQKLSQGEDTIIGKEFDRSGQELSGGQWQRVILSRAYMGEPEFLILDEPTASVDPLEEMRILEHFKSIVNGKTALLISHRIGFARLSNRICVMEQGKIVEDGTHDALMAKKGHYYNLFMSQQELYKEENVHA